MVAEVKAATLSSTFSLVEPEAPFDTLADAGRGGGRVCWRDTEEVKAKALVHKQVDPIRQL